MQEPLGASHMLIVHRFLSGSVGAAAAAQASTQAAACMAPGGKRPSNASARRGCPPGSARWGCPLTHSALHLLDGLQQGARPLKVRLDRLVAVHANLLKQRLLQAQRWAAAAKRMGQS